MLLRTWTKPNWVPLLPASNGEPRCLVAALLQPLGKVENAAVELYWVDGFTSRLVWSLWVLKYFLSLSLCILSLFTQHPVFERAAPVGGWSSCRTGRAAFDLPLIFNPVLRSLCVKQILRRELWWVSRAVAFPSPKREQAGKEADIDWNVGRLWFVPGHRGGSCGQLCCLASPRAKSELQTIRAVAPSSWNACQLTYPVCSTRCAASLALGRQWEPVSTCFTVQSEPAGWALHPDTLLVGLRHGDKGVLCFAGSLVSAGFPHYFCIMKFPFLPAFLPAINNMIFSFSKKPDVVVQKSAVSWFFKKTSIRLFYHYVLLWWSLATIRQQYMIGLLLLKQHVLIHRTTNYSFTL